MDDAAQIDIRVANEGDLAEWQLFVDRSPNAGAMHHSGWYGVLRDAYWVAPYFLIAEGASGQVAGLLPMYHSRSPLTGSHLSSLEEGVLAGNERVAAALLERARTLRDVIGAKYLQIRGGTVDRPGVKSFSTVHTLIDTNRPVDLLWSSIKKKTRWAIRQSEKTKVRVQHDVELRGLEAFYRIYVQHMRDLGTPVAGMDAVRAIRAHLEIPRLRLYLVKEQQRLIGGMLCILNKHRWTDYLAAVGPSDETDFANYLLYWSVIRDAAACGAPVLDLGRSTPGSNVHLFKRKWGGRDVEVKYHFYTADDSRRIQVGLEELKRGQRLPQKIWSHLPLVLCNQVGPLLRKQLPFI